MCLAVPAASTWDRRREDPPHTCTGPRDGQAGPQQGTPGCCPSHTLVCHVAVPGHAAFRVLLDFVLEEGDALLKTSHNSSERCKVESAVPGGSL